MNKNIVWLIGLVLYASSLKAENPELEALKRIRDRALFREFVDKDPTYTPQQRLEDYRRTNELSERLKAKEPKEIESIDRQINEQIIDLESSAANLSLKVQSASGTDSYENRHKALEVILDFVQAIQKQYSYDPQLRDKIIEKCVDNMILTSIRYADTMQAYEQTIAKINLTPPVYIPPKIKEPPLEFNTSEQRILYEKFGKKRPDYRDPRVKEELKRLRDFKARGGNPAFYR